MIDASGLRYTYPSGVTMEFQDLRVARGDRFLLSGESGSGKTTLIHLLGGLLRTQQGTVTLNGTRLDTLSEAGLDAFRGRNVGYIFQRNHLIEALTVEQNLLMAPFLAGLVQETGRVTEVLRRLGLADRRHSSVKELSQGQAQRVAIGRALMNRPQVILADEPTSALDDLNCEKMADLLLEVADDNNLTLVVATHDHRLKSRIRKQILL